MQLNKTTSEELKQGVPRHSFGQQRRGEKRWTLPSHRMWTPARHSEFILTPVS